MARIFSLGICLLLLFSLFAWPKPVSAGTCAWSAETIPARLNNMLGPVGIDVRDFAICNDLLTIYAVPGNSITDITTDNRVVYKSADGGANWTSMHTPIKADLIAIAPDDNNLLVIVNTDTAAVFLSTNSGTTWQSMGVVKDAVGATAAAIYSIDISPIRNEIQYIAVAGKEDTGIAKTANLWYFDYGSPTQAWHETNTFNGFATDNETAAMAFSPSFSSDATVAVVTDNTGATAGVRLQLLNINTGKWNDTAGYLNYPCTLFNDAGLNRLLSASLALAPTFDGDDPSSYKSFIGITANGTAAAIAKSGIYRLVNTTVTNILLSVKVHSVAFNNAYLIAGCYDTTSVYRSANPSTTTPTFSMSHATKSPGGDNRAAVAWLGSSAVAGTSGSESAFAKSTDNGAAFDDIGLIDTSITNTRDVAVSSNGNKVYLVTDNGTNTSLWRKASGWKRVLSLKGTTDYIMRIEPSSASVIYLAKKNGTTIYYNSGGGAVAWLNHNCNIVIQDMTVESTSVAYVLNAAGSVSKTTTNGASWSAAVPTTLASGATIVSVSAGNVLVGSKNGFVAYSTNGSITWTMIPQPIMVGVANVQVIADTNFSTNKLIYAACDAAGGNIMTWKIGTSTAWTDIYNGFFVGGIFGLAITNNILYALEFNGGINQSTLWRHISPATAAASSAEWTSSTTIAETGGDPNIVLNATPQALKASSGKLWAIKTNLTNKLYSYSDVILNVQISLTEPAQGTIIHVNSLTGIVYDVLFSWQRPTVATAYELLIAYDEDFLIPVAAIPVNTINTPASVLAGPQQAAPANINFIPGKLYYWKIRTTQPGFSPYSTTRYFSIEPLPDVSAQSMVINQSGMVTGTNPAFSWQPLQGATEYQFMLSDNPEMTSAIIDAKVNTTAFKVDITLEYGKTYFWRVRSTKPIEGEWSALVTFRVADKPAEPEPPEPPVVFEEGPLITIIVPLPTQQESVILSPSTVSTTIVTPGYLHIIFIIMAISLAVVVYLIYGRSPKQLLALARGGKTSLGPYRKFRMPSAKPAPPARAETAEEEYEPPAMPDKTATRPLTIEKSKEGAAVVFAAKSFMWMLTEGKGTDESQTKLSEKEQLSLGKKLAEKIRDLTKKENLYIKHPEDAALLLHIWAQYGSRDETSRYLAKSFAVMPENAIRLLKCYLPADKKEPSADDFTRAHYDKIAKVIEPDKVYAALTKVFKFKVSSIEEKTPIKPEERNLAFKFMRLHLQIKSGK